MSISRFFVVAVSIVNPADKTDRYGNTIDDWDNATTVAAKAWRAQTGASELTDNRTGVVTTETLLLPTGTDVTARSRVAIADEEFTVEGDPRHANTPDGEHHIKLTIRKVAG